MMDDDDDGHWRWWATTIMNDDNNYSWQRLWLTTIMDDYSGGWQRWWTNYDDHDGNGNMDNGHIDVDDDWRWLMTATMIDDNNNDDEWWLSESPWQRQWTMPMIYRQWCRRQQQWWTTTKTMMDKAGDRIRQGYGWMRMFSSEIIPWSRGQWEWSRGWRLRWRSLSWSLSPQSCVIIIIITTTVCHNMVHLITIIMGISSLSW